ncbi:MAG: AI-2E family transporter [archaeon]|nr:AI-2E family transporter [archaeon]
MDFGEKSIKNISIGILLLVLVVIVFLIVKPVLLSVIGGLILAYMVHPVYKKVKSSISNPTLAAFIVSFFVLVVIIIPLWFLIPIILQQIFNIISASQSINFYSAISAMFPSAPVEFLSQISLSITEFIGKTSSTVLTSLTNSLLDLPAIALNFVILAFVFFFTTRDYLKLKEFASGISPFNKNKEGLLVRQFKDITDSIIYGQIIVGLVQGLLAGLGLIVFGIDNALALTIMAIFFSMVPLIGPAVVWVPVNIYLIGAASPTIALIYFLYNLLIVATIDNVMKSYIIASKSDLSPAIVTIGIIGGIFMFGILGILLGPLFLAYLITFVRAYKEKKLYSLFYEE